MNEIQINTTTTVKKSSIIVQIEQKMRMIEILENQIAKLREQLELFEE